MTLLQQFLSTVYWLIVGGRWSELHDYFFLIREMLDRPTLIITVGKPKDKEIDNE